MHLSHQDAETIGTWGIYFFTVLNGFGLYSQIRTMWQKRSGQSIPVGAIFCVMALFVAAILYGLKYNRPPIIFNAIVLGLGCAIMAIGLWKFEGFKRWERWLGLALMASLVGMILTGYYDRWYFAYNVGGAGSLILQPWEIWRNRSAGAVNIRTQLSFTASNSFWVVYAYAIKDQGLMILCPIYLGIVVTTVILWCIYRPRTSRKNKELTT